MRAPLRILPTSILRPTLVWSLLLAAYSGLAVWKEQGQYADYADVSSGLEAVLSFVIGMLLGFRLNRAFDRWWEARTLWGMLVNCSRNLAVKLNNVVTQKDESFARAQRLLVAFPFALRDHLRRGASLSQLSGMTNETDEPKHVPGWIVNQLYGLFEAWKRDQRIQYGEFRMLDRESKVLLEVCGGCERIRNTPIAASYRTFLIQALGFFLLTLPWGVVDAFGIWTIPLSFVTAYFAIAAECIADHVEHPFRSEGDGLDLDGICRTIESSVEEIFATRTLPN